MWYLKNAQGEISYLKPNKLMIVSRKEGHDIVLTNDASISKFHASITVRPKVNFKDNEPSSVVSVQDTGSKYGTYIIDSNKKQRKLTPGYHDVTLTDKIKFGLQYHIFTLHYVPLIISTSTLNTNEKAELRSIIATLDGVVIDKWEEYCTHLTVSNATLTAQVVQALAFGTPIVSLKYWYAVLQSVERNEELPSTANYIPKISEGLINKESVSLKANAERKVLFKNLIFICFSDSQVSLENIIKYAGGKLVLFQEGLYDLKQLYSRNVVLLQLPVDTSLPSQASITLYDSIQQSLQKKKLRLIPDSEIFLAILYCSIEKYCNPRFDFKRLIGCPEKNRLALSSTILAQDTEDVVSTTRNISKYPIINESLTSSEQAEEQESGNIRKVKLSLGRKPAADNIKDFPQLAIGNKRILERQALGSEESSREGALMIDETGSSVESDSNDTSIKRRDLANEFDEPVDKSKISGTQSTNRRFNLQSKLQIPKVSEKENLDNRETRTRNSTKNLDSHFFCNPTTSKDMSVKKSRGFESTHNSSDNEETPPRKLVKNTADTIKARKASSSASMTDGPQLPKRNRQDEEDMFSFASNEPAKRKKTMKENNGDDLFELLEDPHAKDLHKEENIFEKGLNRIKKCKIKRRQSSLSSNNSSIEEEQQQIKVERIDTDSETDIAPLIRCKKESNNSTDETCQSSIMSLLRTDIDLTMDSSETNLKTFVKVYTAIPKQRIKLKSMYVWKPTGDTIKSESSEEESSSSADDNDDFKFYDKLPQKGKARK